MNLTVGRDDDILLESTLEGRNQQSVPRIWMKVFWVLFVFRTSFGGKNKEKFAKHEFATKKIKI